MKMTDYLTRSALLTIYKCFIRPNLHFGDISYDYAHSLPFNKKLELIQYNAALALIWSVRGSSREKFYQELGIESLQLQQWYINLCCFYEICNKEAPCYLTELICTDTNPQVHISSKARCQCTFLKF